MLEETKERQSKPICEGDRLLSAYDTEFVSRQELQAKTQNLRGHIST